MSTNPYLTYTQSVAEQLGTYAQATFTSPPPDSCQIDPTPVAGEHPVLLFAPHPDDECIFGGLPLRLLRETNTAVINIAVTLGSRKDRQQPRWQELCSACACLDFGLVRTKETGLENIQTTTRETDPTNWKQAVDQITSVLQTYAPSVVFMPHAKDNNSTHIGTHWLVRDALAAMPTSFSCNVIETEFWGAMATPNLMVENTPQEVADLMLALACHVGEVARNPYHLRLPAWMIDNVRRGGELVGGQGGTAPSFPFSTLYAIKQQRDGVLQPFPHDYPHILAANATLDWLIEIAH